MHFKVLPHSVLVPTYYSYKDIESFLFSMFGVWGILSVGIYTSLRFSKKKTTVICPTCDFTVEVLKVDVGLKMCPKCDSAMVPLKGFYDN